MSAKHKRPFYVFAAVAAICCLVLVIGMRPDKANSVREPGTVSSAAPGAPGAVEAANPVIAAARPTSKSE